MHHFQVQTLVKQAELTAAEVREKSVNSVSVNHASRWLRALKSGDHLSRPVLIMLAYMAKEKLGSSLGVSTDEALSKVKAVVEIMAGTAQPVQISSSPPEGRYLRRNGMVYFTYNKTVFEGAAGVLAYKFDLSGTTYLAEGFEALKALGTVTVRLI